MKAVLVLDLPDDINLDQWLATGQVGRVYATLEEQYEPQPFNQIREFRFMPLRPLPEYRHPSEYGDSIIQYFKDKGFDECLDEITGRYGNE